MSYSKPSSSITEIRDVLGPVIEHIDQNFELARKYVPKYSFGVEDIDTKTNGIPDNAITVITSVKMALCQKLIFHSIYQNSINGKYNVIVCNTTISAESMVRHFISTYSNIDDNKLITGRLNDDDWSKLTHGVALLSESNIRLCSSHLFDLDDFICDMKNHITKYQTKLIFIDNLHALGADIHQTMKRLHKLATQGDICIIASYQYIDISTMISDGVSLYSDLVLSISDSDNQKQISILKSKQKYIDSDFDAIV